MMAVAIRCRTYSELTATLAARRRALGMTQLEVDARAGFPEQYTGKLEIGTRGVGRMSPPTWLETLGLDLLIVARDQGQPAQIEAPRHYADRMLALPKPNGEPTP